MQTAGMTYAAAAECLHVSRPTIKAWLQPSRTTQPPEWAFELLALKTGQPYAANPARAAA